LSGVSFKFSLIPVAVLRKVKFDKFVLTTLQVSVILGSQSIDAVDTVQTNKTGGGFLPKQDTMK
jgi:hypothetical protein